MYRNETKRAKKFGALVLVCAILFSLFQGTDIFAQNKTKVNARVYYKDEKPEKLINEIYKGFWRGTEEVEYPTAAYQEQELDNGVKYFDFTYDVNDLEVGKNYKPDFYDELGNGYELTSGIVTQDESGQQSVNIIIKRKGTALLQFVDQSGSKVPLKVNFFDEITIKNIKFDADADGGNSLFYYEFPEINDDGSIKSNLFNPEILLQEIISTANGEKAIIKKIDKVEEHSYKITLDKIKYKTIKLNLTIASELPLNFTDGSADVTINFSGEKIRQSLIFNKADIKKVDSENIIIKEMTINVPVVEGDNSAKVKLENLPELLSKYNYGISSQSFDPESNILKVNLGRKLVVGVFKLPDMKIDQTTTDFNYIDFVEKNLVKSITLGLFDQNGNLIASSKPSYTGELFDIGIVPGEYIIKITGAPENLKKDYETEQEHKLVIDKEGYTYLDPKYDESGKIIWGGPNGIVDKDKSGKVDMNIVGNKTPVKFIIPHKVKTEKYIVEKQEGQKGQGAFGKDGETLVKYTTVNPEQEIEFEIQQIIHPDYKARLVNKYKNGTVTFAVSSNLKLELKDVIDKDRLEFIANSLSVEEIINGQRQEVKDINVEFDAATNTLNLIDKTEVVEYNLDLNDKTELKPKRLIAIRFKTKVKDIDDFNTWIKDFKNSAVSRKDESTVDLIPNLKFKLKKSWLGDRDYSEDFTVDAFIKSLKLRVLNKEDGKEIEVKNLSEYLNAKEIAELDFKNKDWELNFILPKYDKGSLSLDKKQWKELEYEIIEELPQNLENKYLCEKTLKADDKFNFNLNNAPKIQMVTYELEKVWEDVKNKEDYLAVFKLKQFNKDGEILGEFEFSKDKLELRDNNGEKYSFLAYKLVDGVVSEVSISPSVEYENDHYTISNLPKNDKNGDEYEYRIVESKIIHDDKDVSAEFNTKLGHITYTNNQDKDSIYRMEIKNVKKPETTTSTTTSTTTKTTTTTTTETTTTTTTVPSTTTVVTETTTEATPTTTSTTSTTVTTTVPSETTEDTTRTSTEIESSTTIHESKSTSTPRTPSKTGEKVNNSYFVGLIFISIATLIFGILKRSKENAEQGED